MPWFLPFILSAIGGGIGLLSQSSQASQQEAMLKEQERIANENEMNRRIAADNEKMNMNQQYLTDYYKQYNMNGGVLARYGGCFPNRNGNNKMYSRNTILNNSRNYYTRIAAGI